MRRASFQALESLRLTLHRNSESQRREAQRTPRHMIEDLEHEEDDDAKKKEYCTEEIHKSEGVEKEKQDALDSIDAEVEQFTDEIAGISEEVAGIEKEIAGIDKSVAKATEERKEEHAEYVESLTMADAAVQ